MNTVTIILIAFVYVASLLYMRRWTVLAYRKRNDEYDGRFSNIEPCGMDFFFCVCPIINTLSSIFNLFDSPYRNPKKSSFIKNFFTNNKQT